MKLIIIFINLWIMVNLSWAQMGVALSDIDDKNLGTKTFNEWLRGNNQNGYVKVFREKVINVFDTVMGESDFVAVTFVQFENKQYGFFKYDWQVGESGYQISNIEKIMLDETEFRVDVDLEVRQVVLNDLSENRLKLVFPIDHGGLDLTNSSIITPQVKNGYLDKETIISKRTEPSYFGGLPFLRVMTDKNTSKGWTGIGFHKKMTPNLLRSPDSHGCMRLRTWDLMTMHAIFKFQTRRFSNLSIYLRNPNDTVIHPMTFYNESFKKIKNFGSESEPKSLRGSDGLTIMEKIMESPVPYVSAME